MAKLYKELETVKMVELTLRALELVKRIKYRAGYRFIVGTSPEGRPFLQIAHTRVDSVTGDLGEGKGGKAYLSPYMTDSEFFQTAFGLAKAYEEHEVREFFLVDDCRVYGPHLDIEALKEISERTDYREPNN